MTGYKAPHPSDFTAGCIFYVADSELSLPGGERIPHDARRPVLVVSDQRQRHGTNASPSQSWPSVLVVPISSSTKNYRTRFDVKLAAGEGGVKKKGWARIPGLQMIDKDHMEDMLGCVSAETLDLVTAQILDYLGILEEDVPEEVDEWAGEAPF